MSYWMWYKQSSSVWLYDNDVCIIVEVCAFGSDSTCIYECHCEGDVTCDTNNGSCPTECDANNRQGNIFPGDWGGPGCQVGKLEWTPFMCTYGGFQHVSACVSACVWACVYLQTLSSKGCPVEIPYNIAFSGVLYTDFYMVHTHIPNGNTRK